MIVLLNVQRVVITLATVVMTMAVYNTTPNETRQDETGLDGTRQDSTAHGMRTWHAALQGTARHGTAR